MSAMVNTTASNTSATTPETESSDVESKTEVVIEPEPEIIIEDKTSQFDVGDICIFETDFNELVEGEIYGYKFNDIIITHRLVEIHEGNIYEFRGDNNPISDPYYVKGESIIYHYTGNKIPGIGAFILYTQSIFGIWSLIGIIGVAVSSELVYHQIDKINKARDKMIYISEEEDIKNEK